MNQRHNRQCENSKKDEKYSAENVFQKKVNFIDNFNPFALVFKNQVAKQCELEAYQLINEDPVFLEQHSFEYSDPGCFPQKPMKIPKVINEKMKASEMQMHSMT
jgi:hypothetical protein